MKRITRGACTNGSGEVHVVAKLVTYFHRAVLVQLHKSYWVFIEHCVLALRRRAEGGARGAKEKTLNALRSPPSGREAIQRLFPRMSCEAALGVAGDEKPSGVFWCFQSALRCCVFRKLVSRPFSRLNARPLAINLQTESSKNENPDNL